MITAGMVKELREKTGAGMMDCKKALSDAGGDMEKALRAIREKGLLLAAKKAERVAAEGLVSVFVSSNNKSGAIVEVNCETDFVAGNKEFIDLVNNIAARASKADAHDIEGLLNDKYAEGGELSIRDAVTLLITKFGENICIKRLKKLSSNDGMVFGYIHNCGRIGALVKLSCDGNGPGIHKTAKEIAMQVAAASPLYIDRECIDTDTLKKVMDKFTCEARANGKTQAIVEKIVSGKMNKYYKENCLLEQPWIKDEDITVSMYLDEASKELGTSIKVMDFARFERGEEVSNNA